jgi:hypothetical protein
VGVAAASYHFQTRIPRDAPTGELHVTSRPEGAQVYVDGSLRGKAPITLALPAGHHSVRVGDPKVSRWRTADVQLPQGSTGSVDVDLTE